MIVSHNEILLQTRKVFEALGFAQGQWEDAADMVAWRELHGLPAVEALVEQMQTRQPLQSTRVKLQAVTPKGAVFDGQGHSALLVGPPLVDWAFAAVMWTGRARLEVVGCQRPSQLIGYLVRCAGRGVHLQLTWNSITGRQGRFILRSHDAWPTFGYPVNGYQAAANIGDWVLELDHERPFANGLEAIEVVISPAEFKARRQRRLAHGIDIADHLWHYLTEVGKGVLVPASDQSRRGAGE